MIERFTYNKVTWLDVVHPTSEDVRSIYEECDVPADFAGDLTSMTPRTETSAVKGALKITLDLPFVKRNDIRRPHEIKFIATKTHLITVRFEDITAIHSFGKEVEVLSLLERTSKEYSGAGLFLTLLSHIYTGLDEKLDYVETKIQTIEEEIFEHNEKEMLFQISNISRRLIMFRHTIATHERALKDLPEGMNVSFGSSYKNVVNRLEEEYQHLKTRTEALTGTLDNLRDTNDAILNTKQNEVMKTLTIMAFITFPLTLFTSLFGMNTTTTPILGHPYDFWFIVGIMLLVSVGFFGFFKYKNWM